MSIGDRVFYDVNGDGTQEPGEPGIANVTVTLTGTDGAGNPVAANLTTDGTGNYAFTGLPPGSYTVVVNPALNPAGLTANTTPITQPTGFLPSGTNDPNQNFGFRGTGSLGDTLWYDLNRDGVQDNNEPGIANANLTVTWAGFDGDLATTADNVAYAATTDAAGHYTVANLPFGSYQVTVDTATLPAGVTTVTFDANHGTVNPTNGATGNLTPGQPNDPNFDFGYTGASSIGDRVFLDQNANGGTGSRRAGPVERPGPDHVGRAGRQPGHRR